MLNREVAKELFCQALGFASNMLVQALSQYGEYCLPSEAEHEKMQTAVRSLGEVTQAVRFGKKKKS